jgi:endonuclease YncB( thermonuclease family)
MDLLNQTKDLSRFKLSSIQTQGKVLSIYDGDTLDLALILPLSQLTSCIQCNPNVLNESIIMRMKCRLAHLDAVELKTPNGKEAKNILSTMCMDKIIHCHLGDFDKYGRLLVDLYLDSIHINSYLVSSYPHLFVAYEGGKKTL